MNDRAIVYRRQYGIPHDWGTAVNVQAMVFGNMGDDSGTGVAFTRDPATGENVFYGEYLINAQGEDVVAGIRTPKQIAELQEGDAAGLRASSSDIRKKLEKHYRDVQDIEFTIQKGKLCMLQTRNGKRTGFAALQFAVDMVEGEADRRGRRRCRCAIPADDLNQLLQPIFDPPRSRKAKVDRQGHQRRPRRGDRQDLLHAERRRSTAAEQGREGRCLVRSETIARRPPRHAGGRRHSHRVRRRVVARGPRQPADGQGLRRRLRRRSRSTTTGAHRDRRRQDASRKATASRSTASPAKCLPARSTTKPQRGRAGADRQDDEAARRPRSYQQLRSS